MADKKISDLPLNAAPDAAALIEIEESGTSQRTTIEAAINAALASTAAPLNDPTFTGDPKAPTQAFTDNDTSIATTKFVKDVLANSPALAGNPTVPTQAPGDNSTKAASTAYADAVGALKVSKAGDTMSGALNMGSNLINAVTDPVSNQDASTKKYTDDQDKKRSTTLDAYDVSGTSAFPTSHSTHGGGILKGDRYRVSVAGTMAAGAVVAQVGDVLEANADTAGDVAAEWTVVQANSVQATTSVLGIMKTATDAEAIAKASTTVAVTPLNLAALTPTESAAGFAEIATQGETTAGTDDVRYVTPLKLQQKLDTLTNATVVDCLLTDVGTDADLLEKDLMLIVIPANTLTTTGSFLNVEGTFTAASNANSKTTKIYFGATQIVTNTGTHNNISGRYRATIFRTGANSQKAIVETTIGTTVQNATITLPAENMAGDIDLRFTGTNGVAAANDIVAKSLIAVSIHKPA